MSWASSTSVRQRRAEAALAPSSRPGPLGVYLHVPFCASRCDYCAFATWTDRDDLMEIYVDAVITELDAARREGMLRPAATLFVGGGTPSLLPPATLARLIGSVELLGDAEVTVECNPESVTAELAGALVRAGVNRVSLGVQSFVPRVLEGLGRLQPAGSVRRAVAHVADAGIENVNCDLVYGGAGETDEDWIATLEGVLGLDPPPTHVSAYALTVEPGTPLASDHARHPDDDRQARRYELADELLGQAGYGWYEISNFAKPGYACRHNRSCWAQEDYLGFGCAAHSHVGGRRFANVWHLERYLERIAAGRSATASEETLDDAARELEALELAIRTLDGVPPDALSAEDRVLLGDLLEDVDGRLVLTLRGRLLANEVAIRLRPSSMSVQVTALRGRLPRLML